jgi:MYXO-CTERM domain-containing protein
MIHTHYPRTGSARGSLDEAAVSRGTGGAGTGHEAALTLQTRSRLTNLRRPPLLFYFVVSVLGCAPDPAAAPDIRSVGQQIVNGTPSTVEQDAVVMIAHDGAFVCTGTLIRSNLVLTARHCVSLFEENGECPVTTGEFSPDAFSIALGIHARSSTVSARGVRIFVPSLGNLCGGDIALIQLDRELSNPRTASARFTPLVLEERTTAIGYGADGTESLTPGRFQRTDVKVAAVGPASASYETKAGESLTFTVPAGDVAAGESTCIGDSGGPLFDLEGSIVGVTSRGVDFECFDRPTLFTGLPQHEQLITGALGAAALGLPPVADAGMKPLEPPTEAPPPPAPAATAPAPAVLRAHGASCSSSSPGPSSGFPSALAALAFAALRRRKPGG